MALEGIEDRWTLFDHVPTIVDEKFEDGRTLTQTQLTAMNETINSIKQLTEGLTLSEVGISQTIEDDIWERELERALQVHKDTLDNIASEWSKRGFTLPNTNLLSALTNAEIDYANKRLDVARDVAIKNWDITNENTKFYIKMLYDLKMEALKAIGAIEAQMVAGAFASVSASVHMSATNSASYQYESNPSY